MNNARLNNLMTTVGNATFKGIVSFVAVTEIKPLKKSRITKNATPSQVVNAKKYVYCTLNMNHDYEQLVNRRRNKEDQESNFESKGSYTQKYSENGSILKHVSKDQFYVRTYRNVSKDFAPRTVIVDGNGTQWDAKEFYDTFAEYLSKPSQNSSQGLKEENQIIVNNYKVENVQYIRRGDKVEFNELSAKAFQVLFADYDAKKEEKASQEKVA